MDPKIFKALSDQTRIDILIKIKNKEGCNDSRCACDFIKHFDLTQPTLSHHIKVLVDANLLICEKKGKYNYFVINKQTFKLIETFIGELIND